MTPYKQAISDSMDFLAKDKDVHFVGYGLINGRAGGTMKNVPAAQLCEMPTAENLMAGVAIGMSIKGLKPVLYFERADFVFNAMDAIVNHLAAMRKLSDGEFNPTCIIRVVVGNKSKPLFTGPVHTQDITDAMRSLVSFPVIALGRAKYNGECDGIRAEDGIWAKQIQIEYQRAYERLPGTSTMLLEYKDLW